MSTSSQGQLECPIKINLDPRKGPVDTEKEVAEKWELIKKWYMDHPGVEAPWTEWERHQREWASVWKSDRKSSIRYWAQVQSLKQMGMPGEKARHIAYTRVFGKGDAK